MIRIPSGPIKLLLIDAEAVARNAHRSEGVTAPVVTVLVLNDEGEIASFQRGVSLRVNGVVSLQYSQRGTLVSGMRERLHAAFATTAEVELDGDVEAAPAAPAATTTTKPRKPARVTTIKTEENTNNG